eukprot:5111181-Prorocentrum_lima.AAC.1
MTSQPTKGSTDEMGGALTYTDHADGGADQAAPFPPKGLHGQSKGEVDSTKGKGTANTTWKD